jgi:hypothetical protein
MRKFLIALSIVLSLSLPALSQEQMGRIEGRVTTEEGMAIPGAKVVISSDSLVTGTLETVTDDKGRFRFPILPIGTYTVKVTADQYQSFEQSGIVVRIGATVVINPTLKVGAFEEVITVTGEAPLVDIKSTQVGETLTYDLISKLPTPRFPTDMLSMAAGVTGPTDGGAAMGGMNRSNSYMLDGIDTSDPGTHTVWVFVNSESIEEMEILPIAGNNADIGGFTGAAMNMVTKSGGNQFTGGLAAYYFDDSMIEWNTDNQDLMDTTSRQALNREGTVFFGGPAIKDRLWFFWNYGRAKRGQKIQDNLYTQEYRNSLTKISAAPRDDMNFWLTYHYDNYLQVGRGGGYNVAMEATFNQDSPNHTYGLHYSYVINDDNLFNFKFTGWDGYFALHDQGSGPEIYDVDNNWYYGSAGGDYKTDRARWAFLGNLTHFRTGMGGDHEFKLGLEWYRGEQETFSQWDYIEIYGGQYDYRERDYPDWYTKDVTKTWVFYATDAWNVTDRLLLNLGLRMDRPAYIVPDQPSGLTGPGEIHHWTSWAPRIGFTYRLDEEGRYLIRGSWGRYYEAIMAYMLDMFTPNASVFEQYYWDGEWVLFAATPYSDPTVYTLDPNLGGFYSDAFTLGIEKETAANIAFGADYIHRKYYDYQAQYEDGRVYVPVTVRGTDGKYYTVYSWESGDTHYTIKNSTGDVFSTYDALILRMTKRYSNNWQLQASLTFSSLKLNAEDSGGYSGGAANTSVPYTEDPNNRINADGYSVDHIPWDLKINGTYTFPYEISVSTIAEYRAGARWTPLIRLSSDDIAQGRVTIMAEPRGSRNYDPLLDIDVRLEKVFHVKRFNFSLLLDAYNLFNTGTVTRVINRLDYSDFGTPTQLMGPRRWQVGARFSF